MELVDACIARIEKLNPKLNAVVATDYERAKASARSADDARSRGVTLGPLHGLPMTVKDSLQTAGLVTTSGAPKLRDFIPEEDAVAVERVLRAGAIILGKTNLPVFAGDWQSYNEVYGRTNNPWDVTRTVGGSSGGRGCDRGSARCRERACARRHRNSARVFESSHRCRFRSRAARAPLRAPPPSPPRSRPRSD